MEIRKLQQQENGKTRELWEKVFKEDTAAFLDYYYYIKARDNEIYVIEDGGKIRSMIHLNPYRVRINDMEFPSAYLVAVATEETFRGRGFMRNLLFRSLNDMYEKKYPFAFLMPAAEAIYTPYDFRFVYDQKRGELNLSLTDGAGQTAQDTGIIFSDAKLGDAEELSRFFNENFSENWQVCTVRDPSYYRTMILEQQSENGGVRLIREQGQLTACYAYAYEEGPEIREPLYLPDCEAEFENSVKELLHCFAGKDPGRVPAVPVSACPEPYMKEKKPLIMARIISVPRFLSAVRIRTDEEIRCSFAVIDPIIRGNSRIWKLEGTGDGPVRISETEDSEGVIPIAELTEFLFGYKSLDQIMANKEVIVTPHLYQELNKIVPVSDVFLNEVV